MTEIYLDHAATSPLDPDVALVLQDLYKKNIGNASSIHRTGVRASLLLEKARQDIATQLGALSEEIIFTSGGTESNALAIEGYCLANGEEGRRHIFISAFEHPSVLVVADKLAQAGFVISKIPVDFEGRIRLDEFENMLSAKTLLVSVMHANNEVGTLQDLTAIGKLCRSNNTVFHTDACQSFQKAPLNVQTDFIDLLSISAHKLHGPKGIGALFVRKGLRLQPLFAGGSQENGLRGGTSPVELIVAFAEATKKFKLENSKYIQALRDKYIKLLKEQFPQCVINGSLENRLCNNINISFPGHDAKKIMFALDKMGVQVSVGSACSSGRKTASPTLLAMGRSEKAASESLRISLGKTTDSASLDFLIKSLHQILSQESQVFV